MKAIQAAVKVKDRLVIELDSRITRQGGIKDSMLFEQELTPNGDVLLRRLENNA